MRTRGPTGRRPKVPDTALEAIEQALLEAHWRTGLPPSSFTQESEAFKP